MAVAHLQTKLVRSPCGRRPSRATAVAGAAVIGIAKAAGFWATFLVCSRVFAKAPGENVFDVY
eukprot:6206618-Pleurochrysis_carterae.AAC.1